MPNNCAPAETYKQINMEQNFILIGLDDSPSPFFPPEVQELIRNGGTSRAVYGTGRCSFLLPDDATWMTINIPLDNVFAQYKAHFKADGHPIVVFASGDPLFFGFANTLRKRMPEAHLRLYPAFNSLQTLAHRMVIPYSDMRNVSLTGRPWQELDRALIERSTQIGILTDREHTPDAIAHRMLGLWLQPIYGLCRANTWETQTKNASAG